MTFLGMFRHGSCADARRRLQDLCDGELDARAQRRVRRHVAGCRLCAGALARLEATIAALGRLSGTQAPPLPPQRTHVAARIAGEQR